MDFNCLNNLQKTKRVCRFYLAGYCNKGDNCKFSHNVPMLTPPIRKKTLRKGYCYCGYKSFNMVYTKNVKWNDLTEENVTNLIKENNLNLKWFKLCSRTGKSITNCK